MKRLLSKIWFNTSAEKYKRMATAIAGQLVFPAKLIIDFSVTSTVSFGKP
jgi:hypothetical protein